MGYPTWYPIFVGSGEVFKMAVFQYTALDAQGVELKDEIEALSEKEAISKIRNMGYFPTKVRSGKVRCESCCQAETQAWCQRQSQSQIHNSVRTTAFHASGCGSADSALASDS